MKTTVTDTAFKNYLVVIRISEKEWMAFLQQSHTTALGKESGRFYWYHKYDGSLSQVEVKELAMKDLFGDLEMLGT